MLRVLVIVFIIQCSFFLIVFTAVAIKKLLVRPRKLCPEIPRGLGYTAVLKSFAALCFFQQERVVSRQNHFAATSLHLSPDGTHTKHRLTAWCDMKRHRSHVRIELTRVRVPARERETFDNSGGSKTR